MTAAHFRWTANSDDLPLEAQRLPAAESAERRLTQGLLTVAQVAAELGVPPSWLSNRVASRTVTCTRLGRHVRFTPAQVQAIVDAAEQPVLAAPAVGLTRRSRRAG